MEHPSTDQLKSEMESLGPWYHSIDLGGGLVTPGRAWYHHMWEVCRDTMNHLDFRGRRVLDIGANDGLWSFEAERRGAALVVAVDLFDYALERFLFCRRVLKSKVVPLYNVSVYELSDSLARYLSPQSPTVPDVLKFDIVIFYGVLYHLRDPMRALAEVRSVVKEDGAVLLETAYARCEEKPIMLFNGGSKRRLYPDYTSWWAPSRSCLVEMCETSFFNLQEDTVHTHKQDEPVGRIGAVLKAIPPTAIDPEMAYEIRTHYKAGIPRIG